LVPWSKLAWGHTHVMCFRYHHAHAFDLKAICRLMHQSWVQHL
jgi:hypothetical protein